MAGEREELLGQQINTIYAVEEKANKVAKATAQKGVLDLVEAAAEGLGGLLAERWGWKKTGLTLQTVALMSVGMAVRNFAEGWKISTKASNAACAEISLLINNGGDLTGVRYVCGDQLDVTEADGTPLLRAGLPVGRENFHVVSHGGPSLDAYSVGVRNKQGGGVFHPLTRVVGVAGVRVAIEEHQREVAALKKRFGDQGAPNSSFRGGPYYPGQV